MTHYKYYAYWFFLSLILMWGGLVSANDNFPNWTIKGFGTLGMSQSDTRQLSFYRERSSKKQTIDSWQWQTDSRLGIQLDVDITDTTHATVQWVGRDHMGSFFEQNLDWAFLRWSPTSDIDIRVGRLGFDSFLLAEYRNVGYAYPWIRPPHEFYANVPLSHFDGVDIKKSLSLANGYLSLKVYAGYSSLFADFAGAELDGPLAGGNIVYESTNWQIKAGYTFIKLMDEQPFMEDDLAYLALDEADIPGIQSKFAPLVSIKNSHFHFLTLGTSYDDGKWLAHAEVSYMGTEDIVHNDTTSAYLSVGRRISNVTLYSIFGASYGDQRNISVPKAAVVGNAEVEQIRDYWDGLVNIKGVDQKSISVGLRWDFYPKVAFKAQASHFWLADQSEGWLWGVNDIDNKAPSSINVVSFGLDFIF